MRGLKPLVTRGLAASAQTLSRLEEGAADVRRISNFLRGKMNFLPRPEDVYVVSYPRSGTTWLQFMLHVMVRPQQLDFEHITDVSPWFERSLAIGTHDAGDWAPLKSPRIFKSHLSYGWLPPVGRFVYVWRDGLDVARSYYHFYSSHLGFVGSFDSFFERFLKGQLQYRSWFAHVEGWKAHAHAENVLIVRYEDLQADKRAVMERIAAHCGWDVSAQVMDKSFELSAFDSMKAREKQFDHATAVLRERGMRPGGFIRRGKSGGVTGLNREQQARYDAALGVARDPGPKPRRLSSALSLADFLH